MVNAKESRHRQFRIEHYELALPDDRLGIFSCDHDGGKNMMVPRCGDDVMKMSKPKPAISAGQ